MAKSKSPAKAAKSKENSKKSASKGAASSGPVAAAASSSVPVNTAPPPSVLLGAGSALDETDEVVLTDAEGRRYCRSTDCDQIGIVDGYCRYHYLFYWRKIQNRKKILADGKLERYIEELTAKYADKFIELLRKDLRTEKDFAAAVQELELDDSSQASEEEDKTYLEEIRGMADDSGSRSDEDY